MLTSKLLKNFDKVLDYAIANTKQKDSDTNYSERTKRGYMLLLDGNDYRRISRLFRCIL